MECRALYLADFVTVDGWELEFMSDTVSRLEAILILSTISLHSPVPNFTDTAYVSTLGAKCNQCVSQSTCRFTNRLHQEARRCLIRPYG
jgi:hypothetical protein